MGPSGGGGLGKKTTTKPQRPRPCFFLVLVHCFSPKGSCGLRWNGGMHRPPPPLHALPGRPCCRGLSPLAPWLASPSLLAFAPALLGRPRRKDESVHLASPVHWEGFWCSLSPRRPHCGCPAEDPSSYMGHSPAWGSVPALLGWWENASIQREHPQGDPDWRRVFGAQNQQVRAGQL